MSLTRRSFLKKSSYSAAAITVLGTGVALAIGDYSGTGLKEVIDTIKIEGEDYDVYSRVSDHGDADKQTSIDEAIKLAYEGLLNQDDNNAITDDPTYTITWKTVASDHELYEIDHNSNAPATDITMTVDTDTGSNPDPEIYGPYYWTTVIIRVHKTGNGVTLKYHYAAS